MGQNIEELWTGNRDASTHAQLTIGYEHHEVHSGSMFAVGTYDLDLDDGDTMSVSFTTADSTKWCHAIAIMKSSSSGIAEILESPTIKDSSGTFDTVLNHNRNSTKVSTVSSIKAIPIVGQASIDHFITADGTSLGAEGIGTGKDKGTSESRALAEIILRQNTTYAFRIIGDADNGNASIRVVWYEHTDK